MEEGGHMGETEREIDAAIQGESSPSLIRVLFLCSSHTHTQTVWATYVLLQPYLLAWVGATGLPPYPGQGLHMLGRWALQRGGWAGWAADG